MVQQPGATVYWRVMVIPTHVLLDGMGLEVYRHVGFLSAQATREGSAPHGYPWPRPRAHFDRPVESPIRRPVRRRLAERL